MEKRIDELYKTAVAGDENALATLIQTFRPLFLSRSSMYKGRLEGYDTEDFLQLGAITVWELVEKERYHASYGTFGTLLKTAYERKLCKLWEQYVTHNYVMVMEVVHTDDGFAREYHGFSDRVYGIHPKAEKYREKARERNKRYAARRAEAEDKRRAEQGLPPVARPSQMSEEEKAVRREQTRLARNERVKAYQKANAAQVAKRKAAWYQENKERKRLVDGIYRARVSVERYRDVDEKKEARALARLEKYQEELRAYDLTHERVDRRRKAV